MIPLKEYLKRAPDSSINQYVNTEKMCEIILSLSSQYGPNKVLAYEYIRLNGIRRIIKVNENKIPEVISDKYLCDYIFREKLNEEIHKVNKFSGRKHEEIYREIMRIGKSIRTEIIAPIEESFKELYSIGDLRTNKKEVSANAVMTYKRKLNKAEEMLDHLSNEIIHLDFYIRTNFKLLTRLCRFFDIMQNSSTCAWFQTQLIKEKFATINIDILLVLLSLSWKRYRDAESVVSKLSELKVLGETREIDDKLSKDAHTKWKPPETFTRSTTKYWVHPNNVVSAKVGIVRYVPYLIFGLSHSELETLLDPYLCLEGHNMIDPNTIEESQPITSVYLDNQEAECYYNRISRFEDAKLFRLRWYGSNEGCREKDIFVERKTHHEGWTGERSTKERFSLPQKYVFSYLKGMLNTNDLVLKGVFNDENESCRETDEKKMEFASEVQNYITEHKLQPFVRTSYLRAAFQNQDNNQVRFSIDTNLCMVNEYIPNGHPSEPWCRLAEEVLSKNEVTRFPYAILEVKLQSEQPVWVSEMLKRCNATLVYKFSKFQHGMAILHKEKVAIFPHWIEEFNANNSLVSLSSVSQGFGSNENSGFCCSHSFSLGNSQNENPIIVIDRLLDSYLNITHFDLHGLQLQWNKTIDEIQYSNVTNNCDISSKKIKKIDPKSLFAAERVLLFWIKKCVYTSTILILLFSKARNRIGGGNRYLPIYILNYIQYSFIPLNVFMLTYCLLVYLKRCDTIEKRMVRASEREKERIDYPESSLVIFSTSCLILLLSLLLKI